MPAAVPKRGWTRPLRPIAAPLPDGDGPYDDRPGPGARSARSGQPGPAKRKKGAVPPRVNTTRIQATREGWIQGYNAQVAVTGDQLIVACALGQSRADDPQFVPMMDEAVQAAALLGELTGTDLPIGIVLADAGYASDANLAAYKRRGATVELASAASRRSCPRSPAAA